MRGVSLRISKRIEQNLMKLCEAAKPLKPEETAMAWIQEGVGISLSGEEAKTFDNVIEDLLKIAFVKENLTREEAIRMVQMMLTTTFKADEDKRFESMKTQIANLEKIIIQGINTWTILIPIQNLRLPSGYLRIGNVRLLDFDKKRKKSWVNHTKHMIYKNPHHNTEQKKKLFGDLLERFINPLSGYICAETEVNGWGERATEKAIQMTAEVLDIIKFYHYEEIDFFGKYFGIPGRVFLPSKRTILSMTKDLRSLFPSVTRTGSRGPFILDEARLNRMKKFGLHILNEMLRRNKLSSVEGRIMSALYWFGRAVDVPAYRVERERIRRREQSEFEYPNINDRFIKIWTAIESLLILDRREPPRSTISEKSAFILANTYEKRREIKSFMGKMYDSRCDLVHHGSSNVNPTQLKELMYLLSSMIVLLLQKKNKMGIKTNEEYRAWFEKKKLS